METVTVSTMALTEVELAVLSAYLAEEVADPEGAFAPYYHSIARAAGDAHLAYAACKSLKKRGLLSCGSDRQGAKLMAAPSYWITDDGKAALNGN
jgi:hypothetical protein